MDLQLVNYAWINIFQLHFLIRSLLYIESNFGFRYLKHQPSYLSKDLEFFYWLILFVFSLFLRCWDYLGLRASSQTGQILSFARLPPSITLVASLLTGKPSPRGPTQKMSQGNYLWATFKDTCSTYTKYKVEDLHRQLNYCLREP